MLSSQQGGVEKSRQGVNMSPNLPPKEKTLMHNGSMPSLPLPELEQTCSEYLRSVKPFLSDDEYRETEFIVDIFRTGVGKTLHSKLKERQKNKKNWLSEWWNDIYMTYRDPLPFFSNFGGMSDYSAIWKPEKGTQVFRMSLMLCTVLEKHLMIQREEWPISKMGKRIPMDMQLYYKCFASSRTPGIERDYCLNYTMKDGVPCCEIRHVVVIKNRKFFSFDALTEDFQVLTQPELEIQFQRICNLAESQSEGPGVGSLTATDRITWKKAQDYLIALDAKNMEILDVINKALIVCILDDAEPVSNSEVATESILGDSSNRWYDKGNQLFCFKNGMNGNNTDHCQVDGFITRDIFESVRGDIIKHKGKWTGITEVRDLPHPIELQFQVDEHILKEIELARDNHEKLRKNSFVVAEPIMNFGKQFAKDVSLHPDALLQMAIQLAYFRLHKRCVPTYETATTRQFQDGRTETMRACTMECKRFAEAMDSAELSTTSKIGVLKEACDRHSKLMEQCCNGQGIDRHLLGLRIVAEQEGFALPMIYQDKAWKLSGGDGNFTLSTSLSGYSRVCGGMGPMTLEGYGIFYTIESDR